VAVPDIKGTVARGIFPSKNVTVPDAEEGDTSVVSTTLCPKMTGFGETVKVVTVAFGLTLRFTTRLVEPAKLKSPL
jgi:hypothetical protein